MDSIRNFFDLLVKGYNLPEFLVNDLLLVLYLFAFVILIVKYLLKLINWNSNRINNKILKADLYPSFSDDEVKKYTKYYIQQKFQNISPTENDEPNATHAIAAKSNLLQAFIKGNLLRTSNKKYFIILADTGMGKTAFLINLYLKYKKLPKKNSNFNIVLIPLGDNTALEKIKKIKDPNNTILLLDAFDEDTHALNGNYKKRMEIILETVKSFRKIIFTCRTQFFPNQEEEPHETKDITFGDNSIYSIQKLYLSAFDNQDILFYTIKRYKLNLIKIFKSNRLVSKCPNLMFRPMLLSYIDDLLNEKKVYKYSFEMYEVLIAKWIEREIKKPSFTNQNLYSSKSIAQDLLVFSKKLAVNLYNERETRQGYFITIQEIQNLSEKQKLYSEILTSEDKTGRSLLNRNSLGHFKFAHKSILEYFLAIELFEDYNLLKDFNFEGMDATLNFLGEIITNNLTKCKGYFKQKNKDTHEIWSSLSPSKIKSLDEIVITNAKEIDYRNLYVFKNVTTLVIVDINFQLIYFIYLILFIESKIVPLKKFLKQQFDNKIDENEKRSLKKFEQSFVSAFDDFFFDYAREIKEIESLGLSHDYDDLKIIIKSIIPNDQVEGLYNSMLNKFKLVSLKDINEQDVKDLKQLRRLISTGKSEKIVLDDALVNLKNINKLVHINSHIKIVY